MFFRSLIILILTVFILSNSYLSQTASDTIYDPYFNIYRIVAIKNNENEIKSISNTIKVKKPYTLYIPNAFSPDGDGINDFFKIWGQGITSIEIEIYNRWGQMVFKSFSLEEQWDGKFNSKDSPSGSYVYRVKTMDSGNMEFLESGTVSLIR